MNRIAMGLLIAAAALLLAACPGTGPHMGEAGYGGHMSGYQTNGYPMNGYPMSGR